MSEEKLRGGTKPQAARGGCYVGALTVLFIVLPSAV